MCKPKCNFKFSIFINESPMGAFTYDVSSRGPWVLKMLTVADKGGKGLRGRLQRTSGKWGGGVVLKFRTFPEGGWFVKVRTSENF